VWLQVLPEHHSSGFSNLENAWWASAAVGLGTAVLCSEPTRTNRDAGRELLQEEANATGEGAIVDESTATIVLGGIVQAQTLFDDMLAKIHGNEDFRVGAEYFCLAAVLLAFVLDAALDLRRHPRLHHVVCAFARRFCLRVVIIVRVVVRLPALPLLREPSSYSPSCCLADVPVLERRGLRTW
jgi:hypothetical protein